MFEICTSEFRRGGIYVGPSCIHTHTHLLFFSMGPGGNFRGA